jgi:hypothetical protein
MVFKIPAAGGHLKKNRFEFQLPGDDATYSLPKLDFMPPAGEDFIADANTRKLSERAFVFGLVEVLDPELGATLRGAGLSRDQVSEFYRAWMESGRIKTPGESLGSADS